MALGRSHYAEDELDPGPPLDDEDDPNEERLPLWAFSAVMA